MAFETVSLTGSKVPYQKVGLFDGKLLRPAANGGVEATPAPEVVEQLAKLHIPTDKPVELRVKIVEGTAHFQWAGPKRNRDYGAAFDVKNPWAKPTAEPSEYLSEDEMAE